MHVEKTKIGIKSVKGIKKTHKTTRLLEVFRGIILTKEPLTDDQIRELENLGVSVQSRMGNLITVTMPKDKVFDVASLDFVRYVEGPKPLCMFLDVAVPETGAPTAAWSKGYTGKDVIIGIVDTGIDWKHGDFWFDEAKTRSKILYIWDQTNNTGPSPAPYGYGTEWTKG